MKMILDALLDALLDGLKILPFLLLTYLLMEWLENRTSDKTKQMLRQSGNFGPLIGGTLGIVPQCGFSAAASNLYAGRVITVGTLLAVYLSTSDEMLPIFLSEALPLPGVLRLVFLKAVLAILAGLAVDLVNSKMSWLKIKRKGDPRKNNPFQIKEMCEQEHCHCGTTWKGLVRSAVLHTAQVWGFILVISALLNIIVEEVGLEGLQGSILGHPVAGVLLAALVGLIPNCAASVVITQLYLEQALSFGAMMAGLLVGAGVGLLVLFRVNRHLKQNLCLVGILYGIGIVFGFLLDLSGIGDWIGLV